MFSYLLKKHTSQTPQIHQSAKGKGKTFAKEVWLEGQESHCRSEKSADSKWRWFPFADSQAQVRDSSGRYIVEHSEGQGRISAASTLSSVYW